MSVCSVNSTLEFHPIFVDNYVKFSAQGKFFYHIAVLERLSLSLLLLSLLKNSSELRYLFSLVSRHSLPQPLGLSLYSQIALRTEICPF